MAKTNKPDYDKLGRMLHDVIEVGYANHAKMYRIAFIKGIVGGFGGVIGATLVVALLLWVFSILGHVPLIRPFVDNLRDTITTTPENL